MNEQWEKDFGDWYKETYGAKCILMPKDMEAAYLAARTKAREEYKSSIEIFTNDAIRSAELTNKKVAELKSELQAEREVVDYCEDSDNFVQMNIQARQRQKDRNNTVK